MIKPSINSLIEKAGQIRRDILEMMWRTGSGHIGGSLSLVEIAVVLYYYILKIDPNQPEWEDRDRVVLSKGHAAACMYAILADIGFFERQRLWNEFIQTDGKLTEHPNMRKVPGIDMTTGSLGQGISNAVGMAWAARHLGKTIHIYSLMGCGEQQEGQVWEAAMCASHHRLNNLTAIIDFNDRQVSGSTSEVMNIQPITDKYRAFGWDVLQVDGHDIADLIKILESPKPDDRPQVIIAETIKGKGISFMEGIAGFHATSLKNEEYKKAAKELGPLKEEVGN